MVLVKVEFAVQMTCQKCVNKIRDSLNNVKGIENIDISLEKETVIVETSLPSSEVQQKIESTGRRAVLKGYGGGGNQGAAVAMLGYASGCGFGAVKGVVRFLQTDENMCIVDGTLDGLSAGLHGLHIHESGDISQGCDSVGGHFNPRNTRHGSPDDEENERHAGDLGNITAGPDGRATFRLTDKVIKVWDVIGRSVVVTDGADDLGCGNHPQSLKDGNSGQRLACGIIARSAGMFENSKRICACDGVTLWDERDKPLAGPSRRTNIPANNL
ncbi:copper chaperone for superoxide dismutase [Zootermopsis nevadensis]|uniref:Extracellular superoxide dismutase [Cu-Zn] n=1 Tax=Zootermopsis nevadensis TaxID=136037 RepID=A0A067R164_ZOONE|nr:copper chaperone for superoxide dismutase [Zootermopsis nevadensis]KDR15674.1 Copper chaperone for superoxide dismutase [Zootermopsis nevadensis]